MFSLLLYVIIVFFVAIFILGMAEETNAWVCECVESSFLTALATLFAVYYVFNLQYQEAASCT